MRLEQCRALLTGASGGIGQEMVERLCAGGARLLLVGRGSLALQALARRHPTGYRLTEFGSERLEKAAERSLTPAREEGPIS